MKKFLTFAALAGCFAFNGCTQPTSPVAISELVTQPAIDAVEMEVTQDAAPVAEAPPAPMKAKLLHRPKSTLQQTRFVPLCPS
jgi:hypothetical protein